MICDRYNTVALWDSKLDIYLLFFYLFPDCLCGQRDTILHKERQQSYLKLLDICGGLFPKWQQYNFFLISFFLIKQISSSVFLQIQKVERRKWKLPNPSTERSQLVITLLWLLFQTFFFCIYSQIYNSILRPATSGRLWRQNPLSLKKEITCVQKMVQMLPFPWNPISG